MSASNRKHHTAGFSYALSTIYVSFVGNRVPFNVDTIREIESLWMDIKTEDGEGSVAPKVRETSYSAPLTYNQEKAGDVREAVARIVVPKGYESAFFANIRRNIKGFDISILPEYRKAETQKGTPSRGRGRKLPLGLGLRSSMDPAARIASDRLQGLLKSASTEAVKLAQVWNADQPAKAFESFLSAKAERKAFFASLAAPVASHVRSAFYLAFEKKEASSFPDESKLPKGRMVAELPASSFMQGGMPGYLYKAVEPRNGRPYFLVKGFGPYTEMGTWLTEAQAQPYLDMDPKAHRASRVAGSDFYAWGYRDHTHNRYRPFNDSHAEEVGSALGPRGLPTKDAYTLMDKWNKATGGDRYSVVVQKPEGVTASTKTAGMGKAEYLRRLRDLKAKLNHLMSDASSNGTAPRNLRKAETALDAEIEAIRSAGKKEEEEEQAVEASTKKGK